MKNEKPDPILFLDDHRGIYIPRDFAQSVKRECVSGISDEDYAILEQPDHDAYWDVWADVCDHAIVTEAHDTLSKDNPAHRETKYRLHQDGALWLIPQGMEWSDAEDWFVWPVEDPEDPAEAYSQGYDRGNYGNACESQSWDRWSRKNRYDEHSEAYREGMLLGFFSSYEPHEISDEEIRDHVAALRMKHNAHD